MASANSTENQSSSKPAERTIHTYHCLCAQLLLASTTSLSALQTRTSDKSHIITLPAPSPNISHYATLVNTLLDDQPTVLRLADGFEKRYMEKCQRCDLVVGYRLDRSQFEDEKAQSGCRGDVVYLLPGGFLSTEDMLAGKKMDSEIGRIAVNA